MLLCIQTGKTVTDTDRMRFETEEFYSNLRRKWRAVPGEPNA